MSLPMTEDSEPMECPSCRGMGSFTIGDCEDGVDEICPECDGAGVVEYYDDTFIPERDAFTAND